MVVRWVTGFLDSPSRGAEGFWQAVTGSGLSARRGPGGEFATLLPAGGDAYLRVQVVGDGPARCHLDLHVEDVPGAAAWVVALGAAVLRDEGDLVVLRSPAGLVFCLVGWNGEAVRPGRGEYGSRVDQLRLEVPSGVFDAEAGFWAAAVPRGGMPLRLLVEQRVPAAVHLDLSAADRLGEVDRHVGLGATVVREEPGWTALRDPVGREYRVRDAN